MKTLLAIAIKALLAANPAVQAAIDLDVCQDSSLIDVQNARARLSPADDAAYYAIREALGRAYRRSHQGDAALEAVRDRFCAALVRR